MKKIAGIILKILAGLIIVILVAAVTVPILFKEKIKESVQSAFNESVNANVTFSDYKLSLLKNFPNLSFSLNDLSVVGIDNFSSDTLASFKSFNLVFNLASIFSKSGYEVKSVVINNAVVNAIILSDGTANWDIMKESETEEEADTSSSDFNVKLKKFVVNDSRINYIDKSSDMQAYLAEVNYFLTGDMSMSETDLDMSITMGSLTFVMEGMKYLNQVRVDSKISMLADLDKFKFTFLENYFTLNDLRLNFSGTVAMPGDDIDTDLQFGSESTSFKTLLSMIPAVYMEGYEGLSASGELKLIGSAKGIYSDADSTMPDITLDLSVTNGTISYPDLPEKITDIQVLTNIFVDGKDLDKTTVDLSKFHFELAGNPFDLGFTLKTPMSDPDFSGSATGKIDLSSLANAIPLDSITLTGVIEMAATMAGRLSYIEKEEYEKFKAQGTMGISGMVVAMTGYPDVKINNALFSFTPAYTSASANLGVGDKSDFSMEGRIENYIPYVFSDGTIKGVMTLRSELTDASDIMSKMITDTTAVEDTTSLSLIKVPGNIDFTFDATINQLIYDNIKADNVKGKMIVKAGVLSIRDAGMNILGGIVKMSADYDTRDTLKPVTRADMSVTGMDMKDAFNTFNTIQKIAPAAKGVSGIINMSLIYESLLGKDMMPVITTINGSGKLQSNEITLLESATFDKMKEVLKLGDKYSNTFKDVNISFKISDGRVYVNPFDIKSGNLKMNISGDQGLDQTLNYLIKTEIPRADLGSSVNSLIDNLSAQASAFGVSFKPADILKVNVKVTGVFGKPVVAPVFGSGSETAGNSGGGVKETVKQTITTNVEAGKEKLRQEAEAQGDKLIAEAEARGEQLRQEAAKAAEALKTEADIQAKKLIDGAASKGVIAKAAAQKAADALRNEGTKKGDALIKEADIQAIKLVEEAKIKKQKLVESI